MLFWIGWCVFSTIQEHFGRTLVAKPYNMSMNHQANVFEFQYTLSSSERFIEDSREAMFKTLDDA